MSNRAVLSDIQLPKRTFTITEDNSTQDLRDEYGFHMTVPEDCLLAGKSCDITVEPFIDRPQFKFPDDSMLVSMVYAVSLTENLLKPAILNIQHCINVQDEEHSKSLQFVVASSDCGEGPCNFEVVDIPGVFRPGSQYGILTRQSFSFIAIVQSMIQQVCSKFMCTCTLVYEQYILGLNNLLCHAKTFYHKKDENQWEMAFIVAKKLNGVQMVSVHKIAIN